MKSLERYPLNEEEDFQGIQPVECMKYKLVLLPLVLHSTKVLQKEKKKDFM
jgi:hypothetical protein